LRTRGSVQWGKDTIERYIGVVEMVVKGQGVNRARKQEIGV